MIVFNKEFLIDATSIEIVEEEGKWKVVARTSNPTSEYVLYTCSSKDEALSEIRGIHHTYRLTKTIVVHYEDD